VQIATALASPFAVLVPETSLLALFALVLALRSLSETATVRR